MKAFKIIKRVVIGILLALFLGFTITLTIMILNHNQYGLTQFDDMTMLVIKKNFASDKYKRGSLVFVENKKITDYKIGEDIFTYHLDGQGGVNVQYGIVGQIHPEDKAITFENGETYSEEFIMGTGSKKYDKIGTYYSLITSKWGFLFLILVPNFFIFVYQLYTLIIEIKFLMDDDIENS